MAETLSEIARQPTKAESLDSTKETMLEECMKTGELIRSKFPGIPSPEQPVQLMLCPFAIVLTLMDAPPLHTADPSPQEAYRFTWLRTFHAPISVELGTAGDLLRLKVWALDGKGGYDLGNLALASERPVHKRKWVRLEGRLDAARFWELEPMIASDRIVADGATWFLEGSAKGQYHYAVRSSPEKGGADDEFREVCTYLVDIARLGALGTPVY